MGASVAFHLTELGITDVVLLERETLASGSTSKSAGGIRAQFADELNIRIALRSIAEFARSPSGSAPQIDFEQYGYLFLLDQPGDVERFRAALELQSVARRAVARADRRRGARASSPQLDPDGLLAATFCADWTGARRPRPSSRATRTRPAGRAPRSARASRWSGSTSATGASRRSSTTSGPHRDGHRRLRGGRLVARGRARSPASTSRVRGERRWMWYTPERRRPPRRVPADGRLHDELLLPPARAPALAFGGREPSLERVAEHVARRLPVARRAPDPVSWSGFYEMSPDHNAIVGEAAEPSRFLYATGFSGHGFQQAPAVGEHLAELVAGREPTLDLSAVHARTLRARGACGKKHSSSDERLFVIARHAESTLNLERRVNGDPTVPGRR